MPANAGATHGQPPGMRWCPSSRSPRMPARGIDLARSGDFKTLGRQRYAGAVMSQRVRMLADVTRKRSAARPLAKAHGAARLGQGGDCRLRPRCLHRNDHRRRTSARRRRAQGRLDVRVAIAFSPYASLAAGSLETRYAGIHAPVLSVTSDVDSDPSDSWMAWTCIGAV